MPEDDDKAAETPAATEDRSPDSSPGKQPSGAAPAGRAYVPFLIVPAVAILPAVLIRLMGRAPGLPAQYAAGFIAIGIVSGISALGRRIPFLSSVPHRQRIVGGIALGIAAAAALAGILMRFETVGFAALGVSAVLMLDSPSFNTQNRAWLLIGALVYGTAAAAVLSNTPNAELASFLWEAGASAWLAVLGGILVVGLTGASTPAVRIPLASAAAAAFTLMGGEYFDRMAAADLSSYTYAVGVAVNMFLAGIGYAAAVFDHRSALVWGGMGSVVFAVLGPPGYSVYLAASLASAGAKLLARERAPRPSWNFVDVLVDLSIGSALLLLFFVFQKRVLLSMGIASLAALAAFEAASGIGRRWAASAYRLLPWKKMKPGAPGAVSYHGLLAAAAVSFAVPLVPLILQIPPRYGYTVGWGCLVAASAFVAVMLRSLLRGFGVLPEGAPSRVAAPFLAPLLALLGTLAQMRLFPPS
ncbi:MAG: DUF92 domain-containing protein [Planctomycetes bacterium]|nr:DUF92 domain-containing protein [Planctomycetota bacterium]